MRIASTRGWSTGSSSPQLACASNQRNSLPLRAAGIALLALSFVLGLAHCGEANPAPPEHTRHTPAFSVDVNSRFGIADFDGDTQPDLTTVRFSRADSSRIYYRITFQLGTGTRQSIEVSGPSGGPQVHLWDTNGDHALDVVVTAAGLQQPIAVLVNNGQGSFTVADPGSFRL